MKQFLFSLILFLEGTTSWANWVDEELSDGDFARCLE